MNIDYSMSETIGIYKIQNNIDQKVYIGSSVNLDYRRTKHFWMLKKGIHDNDYLQNSFNKNGETSFIFEVLENCDEEMLIDRENFYIEKFNSNNSSFGYNLARVSDSRKNILNTEVKIKLSKHNLTKNNNFTKYSLTNIISEETLIFDNLVDGANYLVSNGFSKGNPKHIRMKISNCLRGIPVNNGNGKSIRKTCYGHKFEIIN